MMRALALAALVATAAMLAFAIVAGDASAARVKCAGTFRVLHNDHIGKLQLPKGPYNIILLQKQGLTCARASALFTQFLNDTSGRLPNPWQVNPATAKFRRGAHGNGFRVKPAA